MPTTERAFRAGLYQEHLEEGAFLYEQRRALLSDAQTSWQQLAEIEERIEAHVDGLVVGEAMALGICRTRALEGDAGELFVAVCVFCRQRDAGSLAATWRSLDFDDAGKAQALADALKFELPDAWGSPCAQALLGGDDRLVPIVAEACAYRRMPVAEQIAMRLRSAPDKAQPQTLWALSRLRSAAAEPAIQGALGHADPQVRSRALLAVLHARERRDQRTVCESLQNASWADELRAVAGDRSVAGALRDALAREDAAASAVRAAAILGDVTNIRAMCQLLTVESLAPLAALGLHWITGADLYENAFVPEDVTETELFDHELAAWRERRDPPPRPDGQRYGSQVRQLSRDPERWNQWLSANSARFDPALRYRRGSLYGPRAVFGCLTDLRAPGAWRQLAYEEICINFGCRVSFESDMRVPEQIAALRSIASWVQEQEAQIPPGRWL